MSVWPAGILEKLDHFQYLNVKSVWVGPIYRSPMRDFGYDVEDFQAIDPRYGTMQDFDELLAEMHNKGVYLQRSDVTVDPLMLFCFSPDGLA